jgi:hypothetical protein
MKEIFISYRRDDSQDATGQIRDWLDHYFGATTVFRDIDSICGGSHFPTTLTQTLADRQLVLAIIGSSSLRAATAESGEPTPKVTSGVRIELSRAREQGESTIPVLVTRAWMSKTSDLPAELRYLCRLKCRHRGAGYPLQIRYEQDGPRDLSTRAFARRRLCESLRQSRGSADGLRLHGIVIDEIRYTAAVESVRDLLIIINDGRI